MLLVVGIALAVLLIAGGALYLISRSFRTRREKNQSAERVERPLPSEAGAAVVERALSGAGRG